MAGLATFPARVRFTNDNGTLTPEAMRLLEGMVKALGGDLGFHGDDVFAPANGGADTLAAFADVVMQASGEAQYMAPMDMQPASQAQHEAPIVQQPSEAAPMLYEMVMQPSDIGGAPFIAVTPGASPYAYTATLPGSLSIQGGTVSAVTTTRAGVAIALGAAPEFVPVNTGDIVTITYTVAPTVNLIPR